MNDYKVYHNNRCSKSRCSIQFLEEQNSEFEIIEYLKNPLTKNELSELISKLGIQPFELIRKNEADFKENFKGKELSNDEWIQAMIDFPKLMERPIIVKGNKAVIGRPTERILELK